ncbi:hypothetical protein DFH06DRAFT_1483478 [Mycena polygramma]|nr:hypothetical protein DFH06DRAFT_1483478 [Mycena polygramma]
MHELRAHLRSNFLPSSETGSVLPSFVSDITRYDTEIEVLQAALGRLISERDRLTEYSAAYHSLFSPVRRLPTEILVEIFTLCSPPPVSFSDVRRRAPPDALDRTAQSHLLRLAQVCHNWYETVMHTPSLWSTIEVHLGQRYDHLDLLARSLDRSANCPLAIHCIATDHRAIRCLRLLLQHSGRWRTADIYLESNAVISLFSEKSDFPLLERLEIGGAENLNLLHTFETAPKLTQFVSSVFSSIQPVLPWTQLHHVKFSSCSDMGNDYAEFLGGLSILSSCSPESAVQISVLDLFDLDLPSMPPPPVECHIRSLDLAVTDSLGSLHFQQAVNGILAALTLPCVGQLALRASGPCVLFWPEKGFLELASRSSFGHSLTKLFIRNILIREHELVDCLSGLPALIELFVQDVPGDPTSSSVVITDGLLRRLTWTDDPGCLTPHLASVHLGSLFAFDIGVLLDFVKSRVIPGRTDRGPFEVEMLWLPESDSRFKPLMATQLVELHDQRQLRWSLKALPDNLSEPTWSS